MAAKTKKKPGGGMVPVRKALAGIEKAQRELDLNIRNLKAAMGHIHTASGGTGHIHNASGKGHVHSATSGKAKGHVHSA